MIVRNGRSSSIFALSFVVTGKQGANKGMLHSHMLATTWITFNAEGGNWSEIRFTISFLWPDFLVVSPYSSNFSMAIAKAIMEVESFEPTFFATLRAVANSRFKWPPAWKLRIFFASQRCCKMVLVISTYAAGSVVRAASNQESSLYPLLPSSEYYTN